VTFSLAVKSEIALNASSPASRTTTNVLAFSPSLRSLDFIAVAPDQE